MVQENIYYIISYNNSCDIRNLDYTIMANKLGKMKTLQSFLARHPVVMPIQAKWGDMDAFQVCYINIYLQ